MMSASHGIALTADGTSRMHLRVYGLVLLAVAGGLGAMTPSWGFMAGLGAFFFGIAAITVLVGSFGYMGRGPCPSCGNELTAVPKDIDGFPCARCGEYAIVRGASLFPTPADTVAASPCYEIALEPGQPSPFGSLCVGCGRPAARNISHELTRTVVGLPTMPRVVKRWSIEVPHCEEHAKPTSLGLPSGMTSFDGRVKVASYRVWAIATGRAALSQGPRS